MNMTTFDFGYGPVPAHQHSNGGGWVAATAKVADTAYVGPDALVYDNARVYDNALVFDDACVFDDAQVFYNAKVFDNANKDFDTEDMFIEMNGKRYKLVEVE